MGAAGAAGVRPVILFQMSVRDIAKDGKAKPKAKVAKAKKIYALFLCLRKYS